MAKLQGFAKLSMARRREIASLGGKAAQAKGTHRWTPEEAKAAGQKGGEIGAARRRQKEQERRARLLGESSALASEASQN